MSGLSEPPFQALEKLVGTPYEICQELGLLPHSPKYKCIQLAQKLLTKNL
jgi:hypothetical protein